MSKGKIIFQNIKSLEKLGQIDCLFIDITQWTAPQDAISYNDNERMTEIIKTVAYLKQIKGVKVILYSSYSEELVAPFVEMLQEEMD